MVFSCRTRGGGRASQSSAGLLLCLVAVLNGSIAPITRATEPALHWADETLELAGLQDRFSAIARGVAPSVVAISASTVPVDTESGVRADELSAPRLAALLESTTRLIGTGFVIDPAGYILTNDHVITDAEQLWVTTDDGRVLPAIVIGTDPRSDLAVLKVPASDLPAVRFAETGSLQRGHWVIALGNPFGLSAQGQMCMSVGIVSATGRALPKLSTKEHRNYSNLIQTTAPINPGNSGGPLFDLRGQVVGVNTAVVLPQGNSAGIGFAVPVDAVLHRTVLALKEGREVEYGYLGVAVSTPTPRQRRLAGVMSGLGVRVEAVELQTPAQQAGLRVGDLITRINGQSVSDSEQFIRLIGAAPLSPPAQLAVVRGGRPLQISATLRKRNLPQPAVTRHNQRLRWRGLLLGPLPGNWPGDAGVAVLGIAPESPLAGEGIAVGTVLSSVAGQPVLDLVQLQSILNDTPADRCQPVFASPQASQRTFASAPQATRP